MKADKGPEMHMYAVPPKGFSPKDMKNVHWEMDVLYFVNKLGVKRAALEYSLTKAQSRQIEVRVEAEMLKLSKAKV